MSSWSSCLTMRPLVGPFCCGPCGCRLRTGASIIAVLSLFGSITNIGFTIICLEREHKVTVSVVLLLMFIFLLIVDILLIYGIKKEVKFLVMLWAKVQVALLVLRVLDIIMMAKFFTSSDIAKALELDYEGLIVLLVVGIAFGIYFTLVIFSYAMEIGQSYQPVQTTQPEKGQLIPSY